MKKRRNGFSGCLTLLLAGLMILIGRPVSAPAETLLQTALSFQAAAAVDYAAALEQYAVPEAIDRFVEMSRTVWQEADARLGWAFFFILSPSALAGESGDTPMITYYHPWADVYLITQWRDLRGELKLYDAEVISGELFRNEDKEVDTVLPLWLSTKNFRPVSLALALVSSVSTFQDRFKNLPAGSWRQQVPSLDNPELTELIRMNAGLTLMTHLMHMMAWSTPQAGEDPRIPKLRKKTAEFVTSAAAQTLDRFFQSCATETLPEVMTILADPDARRIGPCRVSFALLEKEAAMVFLVPPDRPDFAICLLFKGEREPVMTRVDYIPYREAYLMITGKDGN